MPSFTRSSFGSFRPLRALLALGTIAALAAGCVSQEKYDDLLTTYRDQEQQLLRAQGDLATSRANEERLRSQLTLAAAWACEIVGAPVTACLMESVSRLHPAQPYREALLGYTLVQPGRITPLQAYNVALRRDTFYGESFRQAYNADSAAQVMAARLVGAAQIGWGSALISDNGGNAVHWTRTIHQADIVIAFGNITDAAQADIRLGTKFSVVDAVQAIAEQARRLVNANMRTV